MQRSNAPLKQAPSLGASHGDFKKEIQGLRAVAVLLVFVFHLWPDSLPGGYVGVDVFFVISGYLITGLLVRELERTGDISVSKFYARRIKRLMPIATFVLLAVAACISVLPKLRWEETSYQLGASALYFQNWLLAYRSVDYFAAEDAASPLQHYWSLSVEEQYYILWPLFLLAVKLVGGFKKNPGRILVIFILSIFFISFAYSIYFTYQKPGFAYFATTTRIWELAMGSILAISPGWKKLPPVAKLISGYLGIILILLSAVFFDEKTLFPGYAALLPTLGAVLSIVAESTTTRMSVYTLLESRPSQYIGDISYSLYLWHWPVIVLFKELAGNKIGYSEGFIIVFVSIALAHQSKELIEDYFRAPSFANKRAWSSYVFGFLLILLSVAASAGILSSVTQQRSPKGYQEKIGSEQYPGAAALINKVEAPELPYLPSFLDALTDQADAYKARCYTTTTRADVKQCKYGKEDAKQHLVVIGDSHALQWLPALQQLAEARGWRLTSITKSSCVFGNVPILTKTGILDRTCVEWNEKLPEVLQKLSPSVILIAQSMAHKVPGASTQEESAERLAKGYQETWSGLIQKGIKVVVIRDTPRMGVNIPDCLSSRHGSIASCSRPRSEVLGQTDPLVVAAKKTEGVHLLDFSDAICLVDTCPAVVGNVLLWRDSHHLTASYVRTLAPLLGERLAPILEGAALENR